MFVLCIVCCIGEDNVECGKCYFFFYGLFFILDYGCCIRVVGKCGKRDY